MIDIFKILIQATTQGIKGHSLKNVNSVTPIIQEALGH